MAQKRMFDKRVVESDIFTDLPNSSKALYFMAGMSADDKGFFQPKRLQKMCGFTDDDFKILIAKRFFIAFESGVMVVTDWNKNNWLDSRRINETEYIEELNLLKLINEKYELLSDEELSAKRMLSENSIEESSIEENSIKERFKKPKIKEIEEYCEERQNGIDAERFYNFYESKGWMVGKNKMKDWKACIRTWERKNNQDLPNWFNKDIKLQEMTKEEREEMARLLDNF